MRHQRFSSAALAAVLAAAGCSAGNDRPDAAPTTSAAASPPPPSTAPVTASPTKAPFAAADGTKLKSCSDGSCEVIVESGDSLPNAGGLGAVQDDRAVLRLRKK